jgi:hypothetical protein
MKLSHIQIFSADTSPTQPAKTCVETLNQGCRTFRGGDAVQTSPNKYYLANSPWKHTNWTRFAWKESSFAAGSIHDGPNTAGIFC